MHRSALHEGQNPKREAAELNLTASAGVAPNKFLAKIASDWRKPDGLFVIQPEDVDPFFVAAARKAPLKFLEEHKEVPQID